jgi:hypothetical protein
MNPATMTEREIETAISTLQTVQQTNPPDSREWREASRLLKPLFREMAIRAELDADSDSETCFYCGLSFNDDVSHDDCGHD